MLLDLCLAARRFSHDGDPASKLAKLARGDIIRGAALSEGPFHLHLCG